MGGSQKGSEKKALVGERESSSRINLSASSIRRFIPYRESVFDPVRELYCCLFFPT